MDSPVLASPTTAKVEPIAFGTGVAIAGWALAAHYVAAQTAAGWHAPFYEIGSFASMLAPVLLIVLATPSPRLSRLGFRLPRARFVIAGALCGYTLLRATEWMNNPIYDWFGPLSAKNLTRSDTLAIGLLGGGLLVPLSEEMMFRGVLVRSLASRWSSTATIMLTALAFALYHCSPYQLTPIIVFGAVAAFLTLRSGSIVPSIVMHAITNASHALERAGIPGSFWRWTIDHHDLWLGISAFLAFTGVWIARAQPPPRSTSVSDAFVRSEPDETRED